jgi:hypothetical protein
VCLADGKWAYYWDLSLQQFWRVPMDGSGKPEMFPGSAVPRTFPTGMGLSPSPDGKALACVLATMPTPEDPYPQYKLALVEASSKPLPSSRVALLTPQVSVDVRSRRDRRLRPCVQTQPRNHFKVKQGKVGRALFEAQRNTRQLWRIPKTGTTSFCRDSTPAPLGPSALRFDRCSCPRAWPRTRPGPRISSACPRPRHGWDRYRYLRCWLR